MQHNPSASKRAYDGSAGRIQPPYQPQQYSLPLASGARVNDDARNTSGASSSIQSEAQLLSQKEQEILSKVSEIEQQMLRLKEDKMELLVKMFREELTKDAQKDLETFRQNQKANYDANKTFLEAQKNDKMDKITKLERTIQEQITTFQLILEDLKDKKEELETTYLAAQEYLKRETAKSEDDFKKRSAEALEIKVKEFRNQVSPSKLV